MPSKKIIPVLLVLLLLALTGCGSKNVFVLLPDKDGTVGSFELRNEKGSAVVDKVGEGITVAGKSSTPKAAPTMSTEEINEFFKEALIAEPLPPKSFLLYFKSGGSQLTAQSASLVLQILEFIKERQSEDISVIGHSDRAGSKKWNFTLSTRRAKEIRDSLVSHGVDGQFMKVSSHGEGNPLVQTRDNVSEPKNRRVEVVVR